VNKLLVFGSIGGKQEHNFLGILILPNELYCSENDFFNKLHMLECNKYDLNRFVSFDLPVDPAQHMRDLIVSSVNF